LTTFIPFVPQPSPRRPPFAFTATLDGQTYQINARWNAFGLRWYLVCNDSSGNLLFNLPMIGSPDTGDINIVKGYFLVSTLVFRVSTQTFEINP